MTDAVTPNQSTTTDAPRWSWLVLAAVVVGVFAQVVSFALIDTWDDSLYFLNRPEVQHWLAASWRQRLLTPELGYPVPLPTLIYVAIRQAPADLVVPLAHATSLVLHLLNALLVYKLASRWLERWWHAWLVAVLWAIHPLMAEPVAWVTNLKFVTMGAFSLGGMYLWDRHLSALDEEGLKWGVGAGLCFVAGLTCQPQALALGPALVAQTYFRADRRRWFDKRVWAPLAAMALVGAAYLPVALGGQHELLRSKNVVDAVDLSTKTKALRAGAAFLLQAKHIVWPVGLQPGYFPTGDTLEIFGIVGFILLGIALGLTALAVWRSHRAGWPLALAWAFYLPVSGIDFLPRLTADPYAYLPLFGLLLAAAATAGPAVAWTRRRLPLVVGVLAAALVLFEAALCVVQVGRWQNAITLMEPAIEAWPEWPIGYNVLGVAYGKVGERERALETFEAGLDPAYEYGMLPLDLPRLYEEAGQPAKAANILMLMIRYRGRRLPNTEAELLRLVVEDRLPITGDDARVEFIRRALARGIDQARANPQLVSLDDAARYFEEIGEEELARRALGSAAGEP